METLKLTSGEKQELKKRGFFVKDLLPLYIFIQNIPLQLILLAMFSGIGFLIGMVLVILLSESSNITLYSMKLTIAPLFIYFIYKSLIRYIFLGKGFFKGSGEIIYTYGGNLSGNQRNGVWNLVNSIQESSTSMRSMVSSTKSKDIIGMPLLAIMILASLFGNQQLNEILGIDLLFGYTIPIVSILLGLYIFSYIFRQLIEHFHPLYAFGNIGEKIQKLTPTIESQSKLIQSEFEKDQNFGVLHAGFEKLSSTFSEIVSLVIKLENVEKKANKGNLFDSDKYINSLRSDIIVPLEKLQKFLEERRDELVLAQEELSRVRVGGSDTSRNKELSSIRSEKLLEELDANIRALSEMRGKMGNK